MSCGECLADPDPAQFFRDAMDATRFALYTLNERAASVLEVRRTVSGDSEWGFPAPTRSGHIEQFSIKKQHTAACEMAEVSHFPNYTFRHTCSTR